VKQLAGAVAAVLVLAGSGALQAQEAGPAVGDKAPAVVVHDLSGKPVDLGQFLGRKPVFLEFWATWCESCKALLPRVQAAQAAYGNTVEFIGINVTVNQTPGAVRAYLEQHRLRLHPLYDDEGASIRAYQVPATSYIVIADRTGRIVYTGMGASQKFDDALRQVSQP
jgi:thiol-disulfide isomerase/thioredoxin